MVRAITIPDYLQQAQPPLLIDVRSPGEYTKAHIPGALSLPLFSDEERRVVGTAYKQESREKAIKIGLKYFGPKMVKMVEQVEQWLAAQPAGAPARQVVVHCWRGGMRSAGVAWLLDLYGFEVNTIRGGYKAWRHWCLQQFAQPWPLQVLGGYTGCGKTAILQQMSARGASIIDLEGLAHHRGSAFGNVNMPPQPTQEMFENQLALALHTHRQAPSIWVEDESQRLGDVNLPLPFYQQLRQAPCLMIDMDFDTRLAQIVQLYGKGDLEKLVNATIRIQRRLGGLEAKNVIGFLMEGDLRQAFAILLRYYDKWYEKGKLQGRDAQSWQPQTIALQGTDAEAHARTILTRG